MTCPIKSHGRDDHGYYGTTGKWPDHDLPVNDCCGKKPVFKTKYDATPGYRETGYFLHCSVCKRKESSWLSTQNLIDNWNKEAGN